MKAYLAQFQAWWNSRLPRERQVLAVGAVSVALALFYAAVWQPVHTARTRAEADLRQSRTFANRLESIAVDVERARGAGGTAAATRNQSLFSVVGQAVERPELGGKKPSRSEPEGDKEVRVWFDDLPFDALVAWLQQLQTQYGIVVSSAELERKGDGVVTVRVSLTRP